MGAFLRFAEYILSHNLIFGVMIVLRVQSNDHSFTSSLTRKERDLFPRSRTCMTLIVGSRANQMQLTGS